MNVTETFYIQLMKDGKPVSAKQRAYFIHDGYVFNDDSDAIKMIMKNSTPIFITLYSPRWYHRYLPVSVNADAVQITTQDSEVLANVPMTSKVSRPNGDTIHIRKGRLRFHYDIQSHLSPWPEVVAS